MLNPRYLLALALSFIGTVPAFAQNADLILRGGKIITVDKNWTIAEALAVRGVTPFVVAQLLLLALLIAFPAIALWLPGIAHSMFR